MPLDTSAPLENLSEKAIPTLSISVSRQNEVRERIEEILKNSHEHPLRELLERYEIQFREKIKIGDLEILKNAWKIYLGEHRIGDVEEFLRSLSLPSIDPLISKIRERLPLLLEKGSLFRNERVQIDPLMQSVDFERFRALLREYKNQSTPELEKKIHESLSKEMEDTLSKLETDPRFQRRLIQRLLSE
jgi:hypothetical protein